MAHLMEKSVLVKMRFRITQWLAHQKLRRDFDNMGPHETERILHDVGLSLSDMPLITRPNAGPTVLLPKRLDALRLDPHYFEVAAPALFKELQRNCLRCVSWRSCARDLSRGDAQSGMDGYCVNAQAIDEILLGQNGEAEYP